MWMSGTHNKVCRNWKNRFQQLNLGLPEAKGKNNYVNKHIHIFSTRFKQKKCGYCGEYYEEEYEGTLDNGCPACPQCVADEEAERKHKEESEK